MRMFTGDLKPDLDVTLSGDSAVDATVAEGIKVIGRRNGEEIFSRDIDPGDVTVDGSSSVVTMQWEDGDTDDAGYIEIEVEVTWPGSRKQTFRSDNKVSVVEDFG